MLIKKSADIKESEITPESIYRNRREFMKDTAALAFGGSLFGGATSALAQNGDALKARAPEALSLAAPAPWWEAKFAEVSPAPDQEPYFTGETLTPYRDVTRYNNFYEFGMDKSD
ncbi:MAG: mononuclear molybdenum enzyme YedY, partial [Pseudohongiellaceae bacterium]